MQEALGLIPGSGKASGERNGYSLQYCCLENFMDRGTWWATAHEITESDTIEQLTLEIYLTFLEVKWSELAQSCPTLCDPMDCSPPGSSIHGILQARILEWVAISFSRGSSWPRDWAQVSCIAGRFFTTEPPGKPLWIFISVLVIITKTWKQPS